MSDNGDIHKKYTLINVYDALLGRLEYIFDEFEKVYFSFSGGKDSSVLLQIALDVARRKSKTPVDVLFVDLEAQYRATINHATEMMLSPDVRGWWICLPIHLRNAVSMYEPQWVCWNPEDEDKWVRTLPQHDCVIADQSYFPFYRYGMEFEEFVLDFGKWFADGNLTGCNVAIRSDESLNRFRTLRNERKGRYNDLFWTTELADGLYNVYPLYDWRTEDVWTAVGKLNLKYNRIYDFMYMNGWSIHESRICQPYGDDQRKGLDLFRKCEPETWFKVLERVSGANYGNIYARSTLMGHRNVTLPDGHTWKSYTEFLLATIPRHEAEWYRIKIDKFLKWWAERGYPIQEIPDLAEPSLESQRKVPSWRRIARVILKNDKLCKGLSFSQTKYQYRKYKELRETYGE